MPGPPARRLPSESPGRPDGPDGAATYDDCVGSELIRGSSSSLAASGGSARRLAGRAESSVSRIFSHRARDPRWPPARRAGDSGSPPPRTPWTWDQGGLVGTGLIYTVLAQLEDSHRVTVHARPRRPMRPGPPRPPRPPRHAPARSPGRPRAFAFFFITLSTAPTWQPPAAGPPSQ